MSGQLAVTVTGPGELRVLEAAGLPRGGALVAVERAGLCGTDAKIISGAIPVAYPRIIGHEIVGTVVRANADDALVGRRVLVNPTISCGVCTICRRDRANLCPAGYSLGIGGDGGMRPLLAVDARQLHVLPAAVSLDAATSLQVLGTCVHAQSLVAVAPAQVAVVIGLGVSGLLHLQLLRARGATVIGVTRSAPKRRLAAELGAAATAAPDRALDVVAEASDGRLADVVVETVGTVDTMAQAILAAGHGASVLVFGTVTARSGPVPFAELHARQITLYGPRGAGPRDYEDAVALVAAGTVRTEPLATSLWPLHAAAAAFAAMNDPAQLKVALAPGNAA